MSAVYHPDTFRDLMAQKADAIISYVKDNPGKSLDAIATALALPYEAVYAVCVAAGFVILPNASGELHWHAQRN